MTSRFCLVCADKRRDDIFKMAQGKLYKMYEGRLVNDDNTGVLEVEEEKVTEDDKKPAEEPKPTTIPEMEASKKETSVFHYARKYRTPTIPNKRPPPD